MRLTKYEETILLPVIIKDFNKYYTSQKKAIISEKYCRKLERNGYKICDEVFRKIIKHIQKNHLIKFIVANSYGFHKTTSVKRVLEQIEVLKRKELGIRKTRMAIEKHVKKSM